MSISGSAKITNGTFTDFKMGTPGPGDLAVQYDIEARNATYVGGRWIWDTEGIHGIIAGQDFTLSTYSTANVIVIEDNGNVTFPNVTVNADPYGAGWQNDYHVAPKHDIFIKIESLAGGHDAVTVENTTTINMTVDGQKINASLSDGDRGDITVSGSGATWNIDPDVITKTEIVDTWINSLNAFTPAEADEFVAYDDTAGTSAKITYANFRLALQSYFDNITTATAKYLGIGGTGAGLTAINYLNTTNKWGVISFAARNITATNFNITLRKIREAGNLTDIYLLCQGGTNVTGYLSKCNINGSVCTAVNSTAWIAAAGVGQTINTFVNATLSVGETLRWNTTAVNGAVETFTIDMNRTGQW